MQGGGITNGSLKALGPEALQHPGSTMTEREILQLASLTVILRLWEMLLRGHKEETEAPKSKGRNAGALEHSTGCRTQEKGFGGLTTHSFCHTVKRERDHICICHIL